MRKLIPALLLTALFLAACEDISDDINSDDVKQATAEELAAIQEQGEATALKEETPSAGPASPQRDWVWADGNGFSAPKATRDDAVRLSLSSINHDGISYSHTSYRHWAGANSIAALVYPDGTRRKFEWAPNSRSYRGWENVYAGYGGMPRPSSGAAMGFQLFSTDGKYCSNTISFTWP